MSPSTGSVTTPAARHGSCRGAAWQPRESWLRSILRQAGDAVCEADAAAGPADVPRGDPWRLTDAILEALECALGGRPPSADQVPSGLDARRILRLLRQELAGRACAAHPGVSSTELRRVLCALDAVEDAMMAPGPGAVRQESSPIPAIPEYLASLAHDLRSPLTSVLFLVDSLRSGHAGPLTAAQARQLNLVYVAAFGLCSVANDLLEAARASDPVVGDAAFIPLVAFSVSEVLFGVRDIVQPIAEERNVDLHLVPPEVDGRIGHPSVMSRVLLNLVSNALHQAQDGRVEVVVRELDPGRVEYRVSDTGPGIAPGMLPRLFQVTRTAPGYPREAFSRSGLGLAICRRLVEQMGGDLRVESTLGSGTTFICTLSQPSAQSGRVHPERNVAVRSDGWCDGERISAAHVAES